jgi:hypothetical protein
MTDPGSAATAPGPPAGRAAGHCFCGGIRFEIELPTNWVAHCHCLDCQQAHGSAFVTWVSVDPARTEIRAQPRLLRWYAPNPLAKLGFCARCGSSLFFRSKHWPGELHIALANFRQPIDRQPEIHGYYDQHVSWFELVDDLPKRAAPKGLSALADGGGGRQADGPACRDEAGPQGHQDEQPGDRGIGRGVAAADAE